MTFIVIKIVRMWCKYWLGDVVSESDFIVAYFCILVFYCGSSTQTIGNTKMSKVKIMMVITIKPVPRSPKRAVPIPNPLFHPKSGLSFCSRRLMVIKPSAISPVGLTAVY